jgi:hypothetical protein
MDARDHGPARLEGRKITGGRAALIVTSETRGEHTTTLVQMHVLHVARAGSYGSKNLILEHQLAVRGSSGYTCQLGKPTD